MNLNGQIRKKILETLSHDVRDQNETLVMNNALRLLAKWKSLAIQKALIEDGGTIVRQGPVRGLDFIENSAEGCHIAKLIGCYEQPLQPFIATAVESGYSTILNIGCAEGYYAVGMARRMPNSRVLAFDSSSNAQEICTALANKNNVQDRVTVGGLFEPEKFQLFQSEKVLIMCDIEGAEAQLLNPNQTPVLSGMDVIVESHECLSPGITNELINRFKSTHQITLVQDDGQRQLQSMPQWFNNLPNLDQLLAVWEWRSGPTPWLVMKSKGH